VNFTNVVRKTKTQWLLSRHVNGTRECADCPRCRLIVQPRTTAGLWSPVPGIRSTLATPPSVAFPARVSTHAPRRRRPGRCPPLNAPIRRAPATTTNCLAASSGGGGRFPGLSSRSRSCIALPRSRSPVPSHGRFAMFQARHRRLCDRPQAAMGPGIAQPACAHANDPTPITPEVHTRAKSRVSIETWELQLSTGNAISRELTSLL